VLHVLLKRSIGSLVQMPLEMFGDRCRPETCDGCRLSHPTGLAGQDAHTRAPVLSTECSSSTAAVAGGITRAAKPKGTFDPDTSVS